MTEKGKSFRLSTLKGRREKINARLQRKSSTIEDLLYSTRNLVAVEEELAQFNDLFKMLLGIHEEYNALLEDEERAIDDDWFDDLDNRVCSFKRKTLNWVNSARENNNHQDLPPEVVGAREAFIQGEVQSQRAPGVPSLPRKKK